MTRDNQSVFSRGTPWRCSDMTDSGKPGGPPAQGFTFDTQHGAAPSAAGATSRPGNGRGGTRLPSTPGTAPSTLARPWWGRPAVPQAPPPHGRVYGTTNIICPAGSESRWRRRAALRPVIDQKLRREVVRGLDNKIVSRKRACGVFDAVCTVWGGRDSGRAGSFGRAGLAHSQPVRGIQHLPLEVRQFQGVESTRPRRPLPRRQVQGSGASKPQGDDARRRPADILARFAEAGIRMFR